MSIIPTGSINLFLSTELNLNSYVLTKSLGLISRWNVFSRIFNGKKLDCVKLLDNINLTIQKLGRPITEEEKKTALKNLEAMNNKFLNTADQGKLGNCTNIINSIKAVINLNVENSNSKKLL